MSGSHHKAFRAASPSRRRLLQQGGTLASGLWLGSGALQALAQDTRYSAPSAVVETRSGRVQGIQMANAVSAWYGLPYAAPTGGERRFMAPVQETGWRGVREALQIGERSPQGAGAPVSEVAAMDRYEAMGEDCLRLNVFSPGQEGRRPVMLWLHGGGYTSGSGGWILYNGAPLARSEDVVVVTINHRLNIFGHLQLAELAGEAFADSGNAGMLDIVAALEWVRDNIEGFGGDPDNVTIFGQSGGAGKVSTLLAMPAAQGLFHRAIAMSGSNLNGISPDAAVQTTERYLAALGLDASQAGQLQSLPMQQLLDAYIRTPGLNLGPVVDGNHLPRGPFEGSAPSQSADVPLLLGITEHEVNFLPPTPLEPIGETELYQRLWALLSGDERNIPRLVDSYRYGRPEASEVELYQIIASDHTFRRGVQTQAELKSRQAAAPVYQYYFRWQSPVRDGKLRAYHCLDIPFAFNNVDESTAMTGAAASRYPLASAMSAAFAEFARSGNPSHDGIGEWQAYDSNSRATMVMDTEVELVNDPFAEARRALYGHSGHSGLR